MLSRNLDIASQDADRIDVLLVDDREDGLIALEAVLGDGNFNLVRAYSGGEALAHLPRHDFGVILLDVQMPGIDGFETARLIKEHEDYRHIPIIFCTAISKETEYIYKGYEFGAVDYVFKPFDAHILRSKVNVFAELHRKQRLIERQAAAMQEAERSERYLRLAELEVESLKRYRSLADSVPHAVWRARADGTMDYFNQVWTEITGLSEEQSLGLGWQSAFDPNDLRLLLKAWMKSMETGESFELECRLTTVTGESRWHWIRIAGETRGGSDVVSWIGTCTDIHDRKKVELDLIAARLEAEKANNAKTNFLANMSHEIRTPLNSILGYTELLGRTGESEEDLRTYLGTIRRNGQQLLRIIDEILDISKVEADRMQLERIDVDLRQVFAELQATHEIQAHNKGIEFAIQCLSSIPSKVATDPTRLRQILMNVVGNAIKFTNGGSVMVQLKWVASRESNMRGKLECIICDTGIGLTQEHARKLFEPFMQADSSTTRNFGGTGLGLALSRKLARALGGDVTLIDAQEGKGCRFMVELNCDISVPASYWQYSDRLEQAQPEVKSKDNALEGIGILVVDDASDNRTLMKRFLATAGARVETAADGYEGMNLALNDDFQVVLMDIQMPKLDGYAATSELRKRGYKGPIIALTAHALKEERERSLAAGCDDHLTKPVDRTTLIDRVASIVGKALH